MILRRADNLAQGMTVVMEGETWIVKRSDRSGIGMADMFTVCLDGSFHEKTIQLFSSDTIEVIL